MQTGLLDDDPDEHAVTHLYKGRLIVITPYNGEGSWGCSFQILETGPSTTVANKRYHALERFTTPDKAKAPTLRAAQRLIDSFDARPEG